MVRWTRSGPVRVKIIGMKGAYSNLNMNEYPMIAELRKAFVIKIRDISRQREKDQLK